MKKFLKFLTCALALSTFALASCGEKAHEHKLEEHAAVAATCTTAGNTAYYSCECGKYFADSNAATEVTEGSWAVAATGHTLVATAAVEPTCTEAGNTAYWTCSACNKYFSDANGNTEVANGSWVVAATGHTLVEHAAVASTCMVAGNSAYYECACGKYFADSEGTQEIAENSWVLELAAHTLNYVEYQSATCTEDGHTAYYTCTVCNKLFSDENGENEINELVPVLKALGHHCVATQAVASTCMVAGNSLYYTCGGCGKYFADAEATEEIEANSWVLELAAHTLTETAAVAETCLENGNTAYYTCSVCNKYFADAEGTTEIEENSWVLNAKGHHPVEHAAVAATCTTDGNNVYYSCECGKYFSDAAGTTEIEANSWVLTKLGHQMSFTAAVPATGKADGNVAYYTCSTCNKTFEDEQGNKELSSIVDPAKAYYSAVGQAGNNAFDNIVLAGNENNTFAVDIRLAGDGYVKFALKDKNGSNEYTILGNIEVTKSGETVTTTKGSIVKMEGEDGNNGWYTLYFNNSEFVGDGYTNSTKIYMLYSYNNNTTAVYVDGTSARFVEKVFYHGTYSTLTAEKIDYSNFVGVNKNVRFTADLTNSKAMAFDFRMDNSSSCTFSVRTLDSNWSALIGVIKVSRDANGVYKSNKGSLVENADGWMTLVLNANEYTGDRYDTAESYLANLISIRDNVGKVDLDFSTIRTCDALYLHQNAVKLNAGSNDKGGFAGLNKNVREFKLEDIEAIAIDMKLAEGAYVDLGAKSKITGEHTILALVRIKNEGGVVSAAGSNTVGGYAINKYLSIINKEDGWFTVVINKNQFTGDGYNDAEVAESHPFNMILLRNCSGDAWIDLCSVRPYETYYSRGNVNAYSGDRIIGYASNMSSANGAVRLIDMDVAEAIAFDIKFTESGTVKIGVRTPNAGPTYIEGSELVISYDAENGKYTTTIGIAFYLEDGWARIIINKTDFRRNLDATNHTVGVLDVNAGGSACLIDFTSLHACEAYK